MRVCDGPLQHLSLGLERFPKEHQVPLALVQIRETNGHKLPLDLLQFLQGRLVLDSRLSKESKDGLRSIESCCRACR